MSDKPVLLDLSSYSLALPRGQYTLIDEFDREKVRSWTWYVASNGYVVATTWKGRKAYLLHRVITDAPRGSHVDHINGDKLDNRRQNLRVTTPSLNQANRHKLNANNSSGLRGVSYRPNLNKTNPWHAQIMVNRKAHYLGMFSTREEAIKARQDAEQLAWGELCP